MVMPASCRPASDSFTMMRSVEPLRSGPTPPARDALSFAYFRNRCPSGRRWPCVRAQDRIRMTVHRLELLPQGDWLAVCRLDRDDGVPPWATLGGIFSVTRTPDELSIVCVESLVPEGVRAEKGWRAMRVSGVCSVSTVSASWRASSSLWPRRGSPCSPYRLSIPTICWSGITTWYGRSRPWWPVAMPSTSTRTQDGITRKRRGKSPGRYSWPGG